MTMCYRNVTANCDLRPSSYRSLLSRKHVSCTFIIKLHATSRYSIFVPPVMIIDTSTLRFTNRFLACYMLSSKRIVTCTMDYWEK